jgi:hypothetical protein
MAGHVVVDAAHQGRHRQSFLVEVLRSDKPVLRGDTSVRQAMTIVGGKPCAALLKELAGVL